MSSVYKTLFSAFATAVVVAIVGAFSVLAGYPFLFASLGPTAALQAVLPELAISRPWNVAGGHLLALGSAMAAVYLTGAAYVPAFSEGDALNWLRVGAAAIAVLLGLMFEALFRASHAPSAATALLVALGIMPPNGRTAITVVCGIALVLVFGEVTRRLRLAILE